MFPLKFLVCASIHLWWSCLAFTAEKQKWWQSQDDDNDDYGDDKDNDDDGDDNWWSKIKSEPKSPFLQKN